MNNYILYFTGALLVVIVTTSISLAYELQPQQMGNVSYVTGGIGDEERDAMKAVKDEYNLSIVSAAQSGAYVGNTHVVISDRNGEEVLDTQAGPLFYAQLPPGRYIVEGDSKGQVRKQAITVAEDKTAHIHFTWK